MVVFVKIKIKNLSLEKQSFTKKINKFSKLPTFNKKISSISREFRHSSEVKYKVSDGYHSKNSSFRFENA